MSSWRVGGAWKRWCGSLSRSSVLSAYFGLWLSGGGCSLDCLVLGVLEGCVLQTITGSALEVLSSSKACLYCRCWRCQCIQCKLVEFYARCGVGEVVYGLTEAALHPLALCFSSSGSIPDSHLKLSGKSILCLLRFPSIVCCSVCHRINVLTLRSYWFSVLETGFWRVIWWFLGGLQSSSFPSVTPFGVVAHPSAVVVSLELHSSVVSLTLVAGLGVLSGFRAAVISDPFFRGCVWCGVFVARYYLRLSFYRNLRFVSSLHYPELHRLQSFGKDESWMLLAPTRINLGEVVMTKGSGLRPQLAVCPNS